MLLPTINYPLIYPSVFLLLPLLALAHIGDAAESQPAQGPLDGAPLRVEDLGLEHDVYDDAGHRRSWLRYGRGSDALGKCSHPIDPAPGGLNGLRDAGGDRRLLVQQARGDGVPHEAAGAPMNLHKALDFV